MGLDSPRRWALIASLIALLDIVIPFFFFRGLPGTWINYAFWLFLTCFAIYLGLDRVRRWGENS